MKKTIITLLVAAAMSILSYAQEVMPSGVLISQLAETTNVSQVAGLELQLAANMGSYSETEISSAAWALYGAYMRCVYRKEVIPGYWSLSVLPRYVTNWDSTMSDTFIFYFNSIYSEQKYHEFVAQLKSATNPIQFDAAVSAYFAENMMPERFQATKDSRTHKLFWDLIPALAQSAIRVNHPQAVNYAILFYRTAPMQTDTSRVNYAITVVAQALKAKDMNLTRANAWIESQNTGNPVNLSDLEKELPTTLASATFLPNMSIEFAKQIYRAANTPKAINSGVYRIASALKAQDLNLVRANAWIESQKNGTSFELP